MSEAANSTRIADNAATWSRVPLGDVCRIVASHVDPKLPKFRDLPHVSGENIESGTGKLLGVRSAADDGMTSTKYLFSPGDVLYSKLRPYLRKVVLVDFAGLCSADMYPIQVDPAAVHPEFLKWLLLSDEFSTWADSESRRARMPKLNRQQLLSWEAPLPSLPEQKRIAAALSEQMDAAARMRAAANVQLESMSSLATVSLEYQLEALLRTGCEIRTCGESALVTGGIQKSPARAPRAFHRPFLTVRNVQRGHLDLSDVEHMEVTPSELERLMLRTGDLLIVEGNGSRDQIGRNAVFRGEVAECVHQNHVIRVRVDSAKLRPEFLSLYLNSRNGMAQLLRKAMTTTGLYTLSVRKIQALDIPLPDLSRQDGILRTWTRLQSSFERVTAAAQRQVLAADQLPIALLYRSFLG